MPQSPQAKVSADSPGISSRRSRSLFFVWSRTATMIPGRSPCRSPTGPSSKCSSVASSTVAGAAEPLNKPDSRSWTSSSLRLCPQPLARVIQSTRTWPKGETTGTKPREVFSENNLWRKEPRSSESRPLFDSAALTSLVTPRKRKPFFDPCRPLVSAVRL